MKSRCFQPAFWSFVSALVILARTPVPAIAATAPAARVVALLAPGLRPDDLTRPEVPTLRTLIAEGAAGWMVCRAARVTDSRLLRPDGADTLPSLLLTLGSGARAIAVPEATTIPFYPSDDGGVIAPTALQALKAENAGLDPAALPGALGELLHRNGMQTALLGDADPLTPGRSGAFVAMDSQGRVDVAAGRENRFVDDPDAPFGIRANIRAILKDYDGLEAQDAFVVVYFEDLDGADRYAPLCLPTLSARYRTAALITLDRLLAELLQRCRQAPVRLLVLAPGPADSITDREDRLAPVVMWGSGVMPGTLTSASVRRAGLVVNTDLVPTVAGALGLPSPSGATGRAMVRRPQAGPDTPEALRAAHDSLLRTARLQNALGGLPMLQTALVLLGFLLLFLRRLPDLCAAVSTVIVALPLGMLVLPLLAPPNLWVAAALLMLFALLPGVVVWRRPASAVPLFYGLCTALLVLILVDLLTGTHLLRYAWMSYSIVEGARFYGIGNEYMGAVIGAACVLVGKRQTGTGKRRDALLPLLFLLLVVAMGAPWFGAKVGAIPSAGMAFGVALLVLRKGRVRVRDVVGVLIAAGLLLALFAWLDMRHAAADQTHLARALLGAGGDRLIGIARRKLLLEGYLLLHSPWSVTLIVSALALGWLRHTRHAVLTEDADLADRRRADTVFAGLAAGAIACLLCNDSGVTAAAMVLLYGWAWAGAANGHASGQSGAVGATRARKTDGEIS